MSMPELRQDGDNTWRLILSSEFPDYGYDLAWLMDNKKFFSKLEESEAKKLVIDLSDVERLDSQGLLFLLTTHQKATGSNIRVALRNPSSHMVRLLRIMSFDRIFDIEFSN